jgi:hypothetical protein
MNLVFLMKVDILDWYVFYLGSSKVSRISACTLA